MDGCCGDLKPRYFSSCTPGTPLAEDPTTAHRVTPRQSERREEGQGFQFSIRESLLVRRGFSEDLAPTAFWGGHSSPPSALNL